MIALDLKKKATINDAVAGKYALKYSFVEKTFNPERNSLIIIPTITKIQDELLK